MATHPMTTVRVFPSHVPLMVQRLAGFAMVFAGTMLVFLALQALIPITAQETSAVVSAQLVVLVDEMQGLCTGALNSGHHLVSVHLGRLVTLPASQLVIW